MGYNNFKAYFGGFYENNKKIKEIKKKKER